MSGYCTLLQFFRRYCVRVFRSFATADSASVAWSFEGGSGFESAWPNKTPEPTPTSVTPRAMESDLETKQAR
jgi:hypothetical protein